jgi:hypothetical protein
MSGQRRAAAQFTRPQGRPGYQADHLVGIMSPVRWGRTVAAAAQMATAARLVPGGAWRGRPRRLCRERSRPVQLVRLRAHRPDTPNWMICTPSTATDSHSSCARNRRYGAGPDDGLTAFRDRYRLGCTLGSRHLVRACWGFPGGSAGRSNSDEPAEEEAYFG